MATKILEKLSKNYIELLNNEEDFNVIINVGKFPDIKMFKTHSAILKYRSLYFRNELTKINKDENNIKTINLNFVSIQQFDIIINNILQELQKWCNDAIIKYPSQNFDSDYFISFSENALVSLIERDDLQMEETKFWNYVINWGIAQNPDLPFDSKDWSHENFLALKTTLQNCLPLVRYFQMSGYDIYNQTYSYKQILDKNLWKDVNKQLPSSNQQILSKFYPSHTIFAQSLTTRKTDPFPTVITEIHAAEIASWIDKRTDTYSVANNPYEFKLLLRGSMNDFTANTFWNLCNKQVNLVVVKKVKGTDEILGGYNSIGWEKPNSGYKFKSCNDSFIFSLKNETIQNSILSRPIKQRNAIFNSFDWGPGFGYFQMKDNFDQNDQCYCLYSTSNIIYETPIRSISLYVDSPFYAERNKIKIE
ncbi:hypothetical protein C2G38_2049915 [Gigaspora rosea]|uniref:TLDc domain-containing protein n=1 Tax=Gigaspora rosea TaxID=44941 RepID=A0A397TX50_9GLOM|nr:hypothetical protein C2G38_2049915 [Gigaspora rosea]